MQAPQPASSTKAAKTAAKNMKMAPERLHTQSDAVRTPAALEGEAEEQLEAHNSEIIEARSSRRGCR